MSQDPIDLDAFLLENSDFEEESNTNEGFDGRDNNIKPGNVGARDKGSALFRKRKTNFGNAKSKIHSVLRSNIKNFEIKDDGLNEYAPDSNANQKNEERSGEYMSSVSNVHESKNVKSNIDDSHKQANITKMDKESSVKHPLAFTSEGKGGYSLKESIPKVLEPALIKALKDRRNRSEINQYIREHDQNDNDKINFISLKANNSDDLDNGYLEADTDDRYSDGRLALSKDEERVQKLLKRREIEEALSDVQEEISENEGTKGNHFNDLGNTEDADFEEIYRNIAPQNLHKIEHSSMDILKTRYPKPKLREIKPLDEKLNFMKKRTELNMTLVEKNRQERQQAELLLGEVITEKDTLLKRVSQSE